MNESARRLGANRSAIRELFEYATRRKQEAGEDAVLDFTIGNPSVPPPSVVTETLETLLRDSDPTALHGYTTAAGDPIVRAAIAAYTRKTTGVEADPSLIYLTVGAAAALTACFGALLSPGDGDEAVILTPCFPEYRVFLEHAGARVVEVPARETSFAPDMEALDRAITPHTRLVVINSPNNPTGAILSAEELTALAALLREKSAAYGHAIYLVSDEPYRELVYDGQTVPAPLAYYENALVCYSFSKSLSLPGERIGYVLVHPRAADARAVYEALMGAARGMGYVCAPALFQRMIPACLGKTADLSVYDGNRRLLYDELTSYGFEAVCPQGAFYLFLKSPESDANAFLEKAKVHGILFVPSDSFGCPGYVRIAYCVSRRTVELALPGFKALAEEYGLTPEK